MGTLRLELHPPSGFHRIASRLESAGFEAWAVGGAVRDAVLQRPAGDWDLATSARPQQVRRLFRRTVPIGIEHGTVGVLSEDGELYEITTFRRDIETFGRHAVVRFTDSIDEDLARRDFTLNAMAWRPATGELRDPFGGTGHLREKRLATVGKPEERFAEDYLRILRALRFAGQFQLTIEPETWRALTSATDRLAMLSAERVREELWKVLGQLPRASAALSLYATSGALAVTCPELADTVGLRPEGYQHDAWTTSLIAVDTLPPGRLLLRLAALLHALDAPAGPGANRRRARSTQAGTLLRRLKASNAELSLVVRLIEANSRPFPEGASDSPVRRWLRDVGPDLLPDLWRLKAALCRAGWNAQAPASIAAQWRRARHVMRQKPVLHIRDLAVDGEDLLQLGFQPGRRVGQILEELLARVIDEPTLNTTERLLDIVRREMLP